MLSRQIETRTDIVRGDFERIGGLRYTSLYGTKMSGFFYYQASDRTVRKCFKLVASEASLTNYAES